ncbi:hypothetical protein HXY32_02540 [Candidatus Bathyarchaeota archaeon]|nr:hypothetical protein [Candidatus Bathyarchaeota archaeon]
MLIKIIRNLTLEEIDARIKRFEKEFGMSFEKFEEHFLKHKPDAKLTTVYFEWVELVNSYKGYIEEGQLDYTVEEIKDLKPEQVALLAPKRIELLYQLAALRVDSINDLATKIRRNVKNVYQDLQVLRKFGFVRMNRRKGRSLIPETLVKEVTFLIR